LPRSGPDGNLLVYRPFVEERSRDLLNGMQVVGSNPISRLAGQDCETEPAGAAVDNLIV
jgi:hypothetical protein